MKRYFFMLSALFAFTAVQAQYVDFGAQYAFQKGDFAAGDIDNDGDLDLIFSGENGGAENGAIMINDGAGNFTPQDGERVIKIGLGGNIQFGDIDGDGDLDVIFAGWGNAGAKGIALNDGKGAYTLADKDKYPVNTAAKVTSCGFADFNMDGLMDYYFFANYVVTDGTLNSNCILYFQQRDGSFTPKQTSFNDLKLNEAEVTVIDFDNDGDPDVFITAGNEAAKDGENKRFSYLFKNDGFGEFTKYEGVDVYRKKSNGTSSWGDFNGDGYYDLLLNGDGWLDSGENLDDMVRIYKNLNGNALEVGFENQLGRQNSMGNGSVVVDWDNDGKLDFFYGGWSGTGNRQVTELYLGDKPANLTFTRSDLADNTFPGTSEQSYRIADLNGDNKVDLLMCGYSGGTLNLNRRIAGYVKNQSSKASVLPSAPTNLKATVDNSDGLMITFTWEAPTSEDGKYGTTYNLALRNTQTGKWLYNPMAVVGGDKNGWRKVGGRPGNVFHSKEFYLYDLPDGTYEWTVQAINGAYLGGKFAETQTLTIGTTGIHSADQQKNVEVYVQDKTISVKSESATAQILNVYSTSGALLKSLTFTGKTTTEMQDAGMYIVELQQGNSTVYRAKVAIK